MEQHFKILNLKHHIEITWEKIKDVLNKVMDIVTLINIYMLLTLMICIHVQLLIM